MRNPSKQDTPGETEISESSRCTIIRFCQNWKNRGADLPSVLSEDVQGGKAEQISLHK